MIIRQNFILAENLISLNLVLFIFSLVIVIFLRWFLSHGYLTGQKYEFQCFVVRMS